MLSNMLANSSLISSNFLSIPFKTPSSKRLAQYITYHHHHHHHHHNSISFSFNKTSINVIPSFSKKPMRVFTNISPYTKMGCLQICHSSLNTENSKDPDTKTQDNHEIDNNNGGGGVGNWITSVLLFCLYGGLMYYMIYLAPNQTPSRDLYFFKKLLNLEGDDGFRMNEVLESLWRIMGLWPLVFGMLLLPSGRSSNKIPLWPFLILSFFGGGYVLIPYFILWRPPAPPVEEAELSRWPLNVLESKWTAGLTIAAGLVLITSAGLASGDVWKEMYQYFRESKFIHGMCLDFTLLSTFAPFWVYNDMTARKWDDKGFWLLPVSAIPLLGPSLYILLRPSLSALPISSISSTSEEN